MVWGAGGANTIADCPQAILDQAISPDV